MHEKGKWMNHWKIERQLQVTGTLLFQSTSWKLRKWNLELTPIRVNCSPCLTQSGRYSWCCPSWPPRCSAAAQSEAQNYFCDGCCSSHATGQRKDDQRWGRTAKLFPFEMNKVIRREGSIPAVAVLFLSFSMNKGEWWPRQDTDSCKPFLANWILGLKDALGLIKVVQLSNSSLGSLCTSITTLRNTGCISNCCRSEMPNF